MNQYCLLSTQCQEGREGGREGGYPVIRQEVVRKLSVVPKSFDRCSYSEVV